MKRAQAGSLVVPFTVTAFVVFALLVLVSVVRLPLGGGAPSAAGDVDMFRALATLFTFATMIIGLFGIINYFQTADGVRRLAEVEQTLIWNERDLIMTRVFARLLSNIPVGTGYREKGAVNILMVQYMRHLYVIAGGIDLAADADPFEYASCYLEMFKIGGYPMCEKVVTELEGVGPYSIRYSVLVVMFRNYLSRMHQWE